MSITPIRRLMDGGEGVFFDVFRIIDNVLKKFKEGALVKAVEYHKKVVQDLKQDAAAPPAPLERRSGEVCPQGGLGAYWSRRTMTLREYADAVKAYLQGLQKLHPAFKEISHGTEASDVVKVVDDLNTLDEQIHRHAWNEKAKYEALQSDGTPSWASTGRVGSE